MLVLHTDPPGTIDNNAHHSSLATGFRVYGIAEIYSSIKKISSGNSPEKDHRDKILQ